MEIYPSFLVLCVGNHYGLSSQGTAKVWMGGVGFSKVVGTFSHVGGSNNISYFMATTGDVWIVTFYVSFLFVFLKLIMTFRLYVI